MVRSLTVFFLIAVFLPAAVSAQTVQYTKRAKSEIRDGPGNYYPLLYVFPPGVPVVPLKHQDGWVNIHVAVEKQSQITGWMSKYCLVEKTPASPLKDPGLIVGSPKASASSVSAAIRGFALRYGKTSSEAVDSLVKLYRRFFTPGEYAQFRLESPNFKETSHRKRAFVEKGSFLGEYDATMEEDGVGLGVAARVAGEGLVDDPQRLKYLNLLATLLSEASGAYDCPFRVLIVRSNQVNAIAIPGGFIFFTEPMLKLCRDEAELGGIIAHEMSHIIMKHGVREISERWMNIKMDEAMKELETETGEGPDSIEQDLEDLSVAAYETVNKPRLQSYEEAADSGAALMLANAGYDPTAVPRMVMRIRDAVRQNDQVQEENPFAHLDFENRYENVHKFISEELSEAKGITNQQRFVKNVKK